LPLAISYFGLKKFLNYSMIKQFSIKMLLSLVFCFQFVSCGKEELTGDLVSDSKLFNNLNIDARDTVWIGTGRYILQTYLSRDFFPGFGLFKPIPKLAANVYLVNIDSLAIPNYLLISKLYVIKGQQIWISAPGKDDKSYMPAYKLTGTSINGPAWDIDIFVDVIIEVTDNSTLTKYLILTKQQKIVRTE
jgi:hypothetical protein